MNAQVDKLLEVIRKTVLRLFPELAGRYHLTARARVVSTTGNSLQVQPLKRDGSVDPTAPAVVCDPLPYKLKPGNVVRLGFLYGDPSEPYVEAVATAALAQITAGGLLVEGYGEVTDYLVAEHLADHSRICTMTSPVDQDGNPLPGATTSDLTRFDFTSPLKVGDRVVVLPIEEGNRFVVVARL
jgi:hypothetical protein